jgi:hypothetical protein
LLRQLVVAFPIFARRQWQMSLWLPPAIEVAGRGLHR